MRVFAWSDLHADFPANRAVLERLSEGEHCCDVLLLAGDVTNDLASLEEVLLLLRARFAAVLFVPGNHELWVRDEPLDSLEKFERVLQLCSDCGVGTAPQRCGEVWVVPLFSWYRKPEQGADSLFVPKPGEDPSLRMWGDDVFVRWPDTLADGRAVDHFAARNADRIRDYDAPVLSFSHFLPRTDLVMRTPAEAAAEAAAAVPGGRAHGHDRLPAFNFTRVAGSRLIERDLRALRPTVHVYGHQHRNRDRLVDGVRYVSHCLGYPSERRLGALVDNELPLRVW